MAVVTSVDLPHLSRLLRMAVSAISQAEDCSFAVVEDSLTVDGLTAAQLADLRAGRVAPTQSQLTYLAETLVRRGMLGEEWLHRFLTAGGAPNADVVVRELFRRPVKALKTGPQHNLPTPGYEHFVRRHRSWSDLQRALSYRTAVIAVISMGGMGKTCLVREFAESLLQGNAATQTFDAAVWISDKPHPGRTTLNDVLNTVARVLDYPGLVAYATERKKDELDEVLRRTRVLLIIDNFDTITDQSVGAWLARLPYPTKAIITSRTAQTALRDSAALVELRPMTDEELRELIEDRLHYLNLPLSPSYWEDLRPIRDVISGNPFAMEIALGLVKHQQKTPEVIGAALAQGHDALFDNLFSRCWSLLNTQQRHVLLAMERFSHGGYGPALSHVSNVSPPEFDAAVERLADLSLIDSRRPDIRGPVQITAHSLVRAFIVAKLADAPSLQADFVTRWVQWYDDVAHNIGFCWNDIDRLKLLDADGERETMQDVLHWLYNKGRFDEFVRISHELRYYYYVRGIWDHPFDVMRGKAAAEIGNRRAEFEALVYHINIASKQQNADEVRRHLPRLEELAKDPGLPIESLVDYRHARALYELACQNFDLALGLWKENLQSGSLSPHALNANRRWMAVCLFEMGRMNEAEPLFNEALDDARAQHFVRGALASETYLARIELSRNDVSSARRRLERSLDEASDVGDRRAHGELSLVLADVCERLGNTIGTEAALKGALDDFERLGTISQVAVIRTRLASLYPPRVH